MANFVKKKEFYWLLPCLITLFFSLFILLIYAVYLSLHNISLIRPDQSFVGLSNFLEFFRDDRALSSVGKMMKYSLIATCVEAFLGVTMALYLNRNFVGRKLVRTLLLIPMIVTPVVAGLIWRLFYDPNNGIINYYLGKFGIDKVNWLGDIDTAMYSIIIVDIWQWTPFIFLIIAASLDALSEEMLEAAKVDGANLFQTIWHIILPNLRQAILIAFLLRLIDSFKQFDLIYVMTQGGPALSTETTNMFAFTQSFQNFNISYGMTISFIMGILITIVMTFTYVKLTRQNSN